MLPRPGQPLRPRSEAPGACPVIISAGQGITGEVRTLRYRVHRTGGRRTRDRAGLPGRLCQAVARRPRLAQPRPGARTCTAGSRGRRSPSCRRRRSRREVVAGDPQPPAAGEQHVVRSVPARPAVQPGGAGRVEDQRPAGRPGVRPGQARCRYRAGARLVAAVLVVEPPVVPGRRRPRCCRRPRSTASRSRRRRSSRRRPGSGWPGTPPPRRTARSGKVVPSQQVIGVDPGVGDVDRLSRRGTRPRRGCRTGATPRS